MTETITPSIGQRQSPGLLAVALLLLCTIVFASLGGWQLSRGEERKRLESEAAVAGGLPPMDLRTDEMSAQSLYRPAVAEGIYDPTQQFYLEGRRHKGRTGYHVITVLRVAGTRRYVLVNRGWLPGSEALAPVPAGRVRVSGVLLNPQVPPLRFGTVGGVTRPYIDPAEYAIESGREVMPLILMADAGGPGLTPVPVPRQSKRGMHEAYALQWFAFAAIASTAAFMILRKHFSHA